ncbi:MAG: 50S ribosomal protein L28 [Candidatus Moraniibacteriota bacterium]
MSRVCQMTGRGTRSGNSRSHSNIATKRKFAINLQTKTIDGKRVRLSAKAIKTLAKQAAAAK